MFVSFTWEFPVRTRLLVIFVLTATVSAVGCSKGSAKDPAAPPTSANTTAVATTPVPPSDALAGPGTNGALPPSVKAVPAELPEVIARINGEVVKRDELQVAVRTLEQRAGAPVPPDQRDTVYRQVLDRLVGYRLLVQETRARKLSAPPWEVDKRVSEIKGQFPTEQAFTDMLRQRGLTLEKLRLEAGETIAVNAMLEKEFENAIVSSDADIQKFYAENKPRFQEQESVRASHILIRAEQTADAPTKANARAVVEDLERQIKKGAVFADLAKKHSQDPGSAPGGGDLGFFARGQMVPAFDKAAFSTKPGKVSAIVETPFGFHLIKVAETKPARALGFEEVKGQIAEYLKQQVREQKSEAFVGRLKAKSKVEVLI